MKKRVVTAIIMTLVILPFVLIGGSVFKFGVSLIALLGLKEFWDLKKGSKQYPLVIRLISMLCLILMIICDKSLFGHTNSYLFYVGVPYSSIIVSCILLLTPSIFYNKNYSIEDAFKLLGMVLLIGISAKSAIVSREINIFIFVYLALVSIFNEMFALFIGSKFGKHKLLPKVSPHKSIEGSIGGLVVGSFIALLFAHFTFSKISFKLFIITIILGIAGQLGDLFFSKIKRENGIKDFSNLLPGHGGILDRTDSLIWVLLVYSLLYL